MIFMASEMQETSLMKYGLLQASSKGPCTLPSKMSEISSKCWQVIEIVLRGVGILKIEEMVHKC